MPSNLRIKISLLYFLMNVFLNTSIRAQENSNSLRKIWKDPKQNEEKRFNAINQFYALNTLNNPSASMEAAKVHLALANQKKNLKQILKANNELSIIHSLLGRQDSASLFIKESIKIAEQTNDSSQLGILYMNHGNILQMDGRFKESVNRYFKSLDILEKFNAKPLHQAFVYDNLGSLYFELGSNEIAQSYFKKALYIYQQLKGSDAVGRYGSFGRVWMDLSKTYYNLGKYKDAKSAFKRAAKMLKRHSNLHALSSAYLMAVFIYEKENQLAMARHYLNLAHKISKDFGNENAILEVLVESINFSIRHNTAILQKDKEKLAELTKTSTDQKIKAKGYRLLHKLYKLEGNERLAFEMLEKFTTLSDSLDSANDKLTIIREELQNINNSKILKIQIENERIQSKKEMSHFKKMFSIALLSLFTVLLVIGYFRIKIKANRGERSALLEEIEQLKKNGLEVQQNAVSTFELNRAKLEEHIQKKMNETDWSVLNVLLENPVISNKELAEKVFLSSDGVGSSLRRMYAIFDIQESKYMKIGLLLKTIKISNHS